MSFVWGAIFLLMAAVIAIVIVRPLHALGFPTHRRPRLWEVIEAVASNILICYLPAILLGAIVCVLFERPLTHFAYFIAPQVSESLGLFGLFSFVVAFVWTAIVSGVTVFTLRESTHPDYDPVEQWSSGMMRVVEGMKDERIQRAIKKGRSRRSSKKSGKRSQ